jgi:hypothetical protein
VKLEASGSGERQIALQPEPGRRDKQKSEREREKFNLRKQNALAM